jgi:hypothetical protein
MAHIQTVNEHLTTLCSSRWETVAHYFGSGMK